MEEYNPYLKATLLEAAQNQIKENNPPYVKETFERLMKNGHSRQQALEAIAAVLIGEIYEVMKNKVPFNDERYQGGLDKLK